MGGRREGIRNRPETMSKLPHENTVSTWASASACSITPLATCGQDGAVTQRAEMRTCGSHASHGGCVWWGGMVWVAGVNGVGFTPCLPAREKFERLVDSAEPGIEALLVVVRDDHVVPRLGRELRGVDALHARERRREM